MTTKIENNVILWLQKWRTILFCDYKNGEQFYFVTAKMELRTQTDPTFTKTKSSTIVCPRPKAGISIRWQPFQIGFVPTMTTYDSQSSPAKVKKQLCGCRNSPKRCIPGLVCIMSFQKKIQHRKKIDQKYFFSKKIFSKIFFRFFSILFLQKTSLTTFPLSFRPGLAPRAQSSNNLLWHEHCKLLRHRRDTRRR